MEALPKKKWPYDNRRNGKKGESDSEKDKIKEEISEAKKLDSEAKEIKSEAWSTELGDRKYADIEHCQKEKKSLAPHRFCSFLIVKIIICSVRKCFFAQARTKEARQATVPFYIESLIIYFFDALTFWLQREFIVLQKIKRIVGYVKIKLLIVLL